MAAEHEHARTCDRGRGEGRTVSDEVSEDVCCLRLRDDAVCGHLIEDGLGAQHGKKRVCVGVVWSSRIQRCLRRGAPVIKPGNLPSECDNGMTTVAAEQLTGFQ